ncbi:amino acid adenylation domain-containing protein [Amycolatopsis sp. NPDC058340]|uniref:non-ribosomal peptide synthetase n=1 Tax=Amycolatopsis sp. NPDC058340 TaxID=3346453 RepID=UPI00364F94DD
MTGAPGKAVVRRPLSFGQQRLWFLDQLAPGKTGYLTPCSYLLEGAVDATVLERALRHVARRHEVLRSTVDIEHGEPCAVPRPPETIRLDRFDLSSRPEPDEEAGRVVRELLAEPCDLRTGPVLRAALIDLGGRRSLFHFHVHHIAFDGLSRPLFERELSVAYQAFADGLDAPDPPVRGYAEHARWQRESLRGKELDRLLGYWCEQLGDAPQVLDFPLDRPRPAEFDIRGDQIDRVVPADVTARLRRFAAAHRTSLFSVTLAAYQILLARYCGTEQVVVGSAVAGRGETDFEDTIGFFTNTVALHGDLRSDPSFAGHVSRVHDDVLDALDHQDVPFERLIESLGAERRVDRAPLVQHWFDLGDGLLLDKALDLPGIGVTAVEYPETTTRFDTEMHLVADEAALTVRLVYARGLFEPRAMRRFADHFVRLLGEVTLRPDARVSESALPAEAERRELLALGAGPDAGLRDPVTVGRRFDEVVTASPEAVAVSSDVDSLTYRELDDRSDSLAARLRAEGVGPEKVVGICLPRGIDLIVAMLATVKAGGGYLPIDPGLPAERIAYLVQDSRAVLVVADETSRSRLPAMDSPILRVDGPPPASPVTGARPAEPDDLLYVVYTSGSTGRPKGVAVTHRSFDNLLGWHLTRYPGGPGTVVAQTAGSSFDAAGWEIWPALLSGARLDICSDTLVRSPEELAEHFEAAGTTTAFVPTALAERLIRQPLDTASGLRRLLTGGDLFRPRAQDDPRVPIVNHYGPTENTVVATASGELRAPWLDNSIGRPIDGVRAYVVDASLNLVPRGAPGELYLGGESVTRGYLHRGGLTAERFVPDPFIGTPGARMYRTGDLVRWREDDALEFRGRADSQVKLSGYRIEPGEVESALLRCDGVSEAAVTVTTDGSPILAAYVVPDREGRPPSPAALRARLRRELPAYMMPSAFVFLPRLPLTVNGKIDQKRLPPVSAAVPEVVAPRTPVEEIVHRLWTEVLPGGEIGVESDFFAVGGTSMAASRLVARIRERFRIEFEVRAVFDLRTVAEQGVEIEKRIADEISRMTPEEIARALGE